MSEGAAALLAKVPAWAPAAVAGAGATLAVYYWAKRRFGRVVKISVPATTANLACGFDAFGAAFELRMCLRAELCDGLNATCFEYEGEGAEGVCCTEKNLIWKSACVCARMFGGGKELPKMKISVSNCVPFGRGLGSSATAIIAGVVLANEVLGLKLSKKQLIDAGLQIENHPDNLSPALYGGAVASGVGVDGASMIVPFSINRAVKAVVLIPDFEVETEKARQVLPATYLRADCVFNIQRAGLLPLALSAPTLDKRLVRECMKDKLHQEYRAPLIPGLVECMRLPETSSNPHLVATVLSGAGPTILSLATGDLESIGKLMQQTMREKGVQSRYLVLPFAHVGATVSWSFW